MNALIQVEGLVVGYGPEVPVCAPVDTLVGPGRALAVVGENGAGKSTLLRTLTGLLPPLSGRVRLLGRAVDERSARQRAAVAVDLGDDAFLPAVSVREHLELVALGHGVPDVKAAVEAELKRFDLEPRAHVTPDALSSGQRRRALLAAAFVRPARLLILDEPEQRLDAGMRDRLGVLLRERVEAGAGVVLVTHDPALVRACATDGLVLGQDDSSEVTGEDAARCIEAM